MNGYSVLIARRSFGLATATEYVWPHAAEWLECFLYAHRLRSESFYTVEFHHTVESISQTSHEYFFFKRCVVSSTVRTQASVMPIADSSIYCFEDLCCAFIMMMLINHRGPHAGAVELNGEIRHFVVTASVRQAIDRARSFLFCFWRNTKIFCLFVHPFKR